MPLPVLDFWFDFASTYSYLAAMRIEPLGAKSRGPGALAPVPAGTDFQGAGLDHLAVQPLPGQGPPYVARPRAVMRGVAARVPPSRSLPAEQSARGARGAGGARPAVGRSILP